MRTQRIFSKSWRILIDQVHAGGRSEQETCEHGLGIEPAHAVTGGEPNAAFGGNVDGLRFLAGQTVRDGPEAEIVGAGRIDAQQAAFGREIDRAPRIEGKYGRLPEKIVNLREGQLVKRRRLPCKRCRAT